MPIEEAPCIELGSVSRTPSVIASPSPSETSASSSEPQNIRATPLFRALALPPPEPEQPPGQDELERRLPGYQRIVIPRELTLIELLKQYSGVTLDEDVLRIREAKLRVVAERVGLRRLHILVPRLRSLTLDGSALSSLRDLGIGLVRLKFLSVNRCGLYSLDGVWGLGALREFHAAGNRLLDLQPLAALQKLHTLDLADNPISESSRLWTLGVCGALRRLTLRGTDVADSLNYRSIVTSTLPMLLYLDDVQLGNEVAYNSDEIFETSSISSESGESDAETKDKKEIKEQELDSLEPQPSSSGTHSGQEHSSTQETSLKDVYDLVKPNRLCRQRPATTEGAGIRPSRPKLQRRPHTAAVRPNIDAPTRLQIMNTLMEAKQELVTQTMEDATRALAAEIPRASCIEDWIKFKEETGIDININFNERLQESDPSKAIERLEQIEKETRERLKYGDGFYNEVANINFHDTPTNFTNSVSSINGDDLWRMDPFQPAPRNINSSIDDLEEITSGRNIRDMIDYNESRND